MNPLPLRPPKRVSPVRARRRRARLLILSTIIALLIFVALALSYLSYLPRYSVASVEIEGATDTPASLVRDYAESIIYNGSHNFLSRANMFLFPRALIEKDIPLEFPRIQSATVSRPSPLSNTIEIRVTERQPFALWCSDAGACYEMDKSGFIFAQAVSSSTGAYLFSGSLNEATSSSATSSAQSAPVQNPIGQTFAPGHLPGLIELLNLLGQAGFPASGAEVQSDQDFSVPLAAGFPIYASFGEDPGVLVGNLQLILSSDALQGQEQNLEYVDLRFGDRVYYKLKGQDQESASSQ